MITWLLTFCILVIVIFAMALGVILSKKPIAGSCGGLNKLGLKEDCPICGGSKKDVMDDGNDNLVVFYDAMKPKISSHS